MKFTSVSTKLYLATISVSAICLLICSYILFYYAQESKIEIYENTQGELIQNTDDKINAKINIGITNAISIANDDRIKKAFITNNRKYAIDSLNNISQRMKEDTNYKNIKIHLHTKNNISFLRNWKLNKYGDDLSSFRAAVVNVNKTKTPITTFEAGREGLLLRSIIPIFDDNNNHLGSLEFIQGINSVAKEFNKNKIGFLLLMDNPDMQAKSNDANFSFNKNKLFQNYVISQKFINKKFIDDASNINVKKLIDNGYLLGSNYFFTYTKILNFQNKTVGMVLLGKPLNVVNEIINDEEKLIYISLFGIFIMTLVIAFVLIIAIKKLVTTPLKIFETSLMDFFLFLQAKKDYTNDIKIDTNDEFGLMADSLKQNIEFSAKLHNEIYELNANLENKVKEKTTKLTTLLDNAGQGFLAFNKEFVIDGEYSKECIKFLGNNIASQDISKLLFTDSKKQDFFKSTLLSAFNESILIKRNAYLSLMPKFAILNKKIIRLEYKILEDKSFMLILTNVTSEKKLEKKIKKEQETFKMIVAVVSETQVFYDIKGEYKNFIDSIKNENISFNTINDIYRTIHTFKGSFSQLFMEDIVKVLHELESKISLLLNEKKDNKQKLLELLSLTDFNTSLDKTLIIIKDVLGNEFLDEHNFIKIDLSNIKVLQEKISKVLSQEDAASLECHDILTQVQNLSNIKLYDLLKPYTSLVSQLATRLHKEINELEIYGDKNLYVPEKIKPFIKSLIHVFRNNIDHGIEIPDIRVEVEKDEKGMVLCKFEQVDNNLIITISDDGAGIDIEKIKDKLIKQNIDISNLNEQELYSFIFKNEFSTKESVTNISGRGIGMSAVKFELDNLNGIVNIQSEKNIGTSFKFVIPL